MLPIFVIVSLLKVMHSGADPGEVKWVNFHPLPPFFWAPFFLFFSLSLKYRNNFWFSLIEVENVHKRWLVLPINLFSHAFLAHKHTVKNSPQKLQQFTPPPPISKSWIRAWLLFECNTYILNSRFPIAKTIFTIWSRNSRTNRKRWEAIFRYGVVSYRI